MDTYEDQVIFSQQFPDAQPMAMLKEAEELSKTALAERDIPTPTFEEFLRQIKENYTYELKPNAENMSKQFISQAIAVCREFEIDTEICKRNYEIVATMDLYCGWHDSAFKCAIAALLDLATDFTLSSDKNKPEYIRISFSYHTHIIYKNGKKRDWW